MTHALVLAAGLGSRIRHIAGGLPKPLMPFGNSTILEHNLAWLAVAGIRDAWINLHYGADLIRSRIGDGSAYGLRVHYVYEPELLGTAGALKNFGPAANQSMLLVYGDNVVRFDLDKLNQAHERSGAEATVVVYDRHRHLNTGIAGGGVQIADDFAITRFVEGPKTARMSSLVNAGVYRLEPSILDLIHPGVSTDFGRDVFPAMVKQDRKLMAHIMDDAGLCLGLDTPESHAAGQSLLSDNRLVLA
ncbi:MAG: hypothetical protein CGW95_00295 [Phenylobacterium zucineum]|nr:MAG: hypothetical protein CGW95_00295 [Phenylobacterium zucineum]